MSTRLLQPFARFGGVLIFLFLEMVSFYLVVSFNKKQNQIYLTTTNSITGTVYERYDEIIDYFSLKKQIEDLHAENAMLRNRLGIAQYEDLPAVDSLTATDTSRLKFEIFPAKVISNYYANSNNMLTINRGKNQGILPDMGVMEATGLVGIIRQTSNNYATVMSLFHTQTRISAKIKNTNAYGSLGWDGKSPGLMNLNAIPKHDTVKVGDTIITSGYARHFPPDLVIGEIVESTLEPGNNFYTIRVKLTNDLRKVKQVYAIKNQDWEELNKVEKNRDQ